MDTEEISAVLSSTQAILGEYKDLMDAVFDLWKWCAKHPTLTLTGEEISHLLRPSLAVFLEGVDSE